MLDWAFRQSPYDNIITQARKMLYSLSTNLSPNLVSPSVGTRPKSAFFEPSHPSRLVLSRPLNLNGRLHLNRLWRPSSIPPPYSPNGVPSPEPIKTTEGLMGEFVEMELEVREYEVNQFGVVNYPIYSSYIQHAHHEIVINKFGVDGSGYGRAQPVSVTNLSLHFIAPLKIREKFILKVRVSQASIARIHFEHFIFKLPSYEPILEAKSCVVWLDENFRPVRIPSEFKYKFIQSGLYR